jgi:ribosome recycling factor
MTEEIEFILDSKRINDWFYCSLRKRILNIRAGKASPAMLEVFCRIIMDQRPLSQVSKISVPDARTITLQPLKNMLHPIEKAIMIANIGFNQ